MTPYGRRRVRREPAVPRGRARAPRRNRVGSAPGFPRPSVAVASSRTRGERRVERRLRARQVRRVPGLAPAHAGRRDRATPACLGSRGDAFSAASSFATVGCVRGVARRDSGERALRAPSRTTAGRRRAPGDSESTPRTVPRRAAPRRRAPPATILVRCLIEHPVSRVVATGVCVELDRVVRCEEGVRADRCSRAAPSCFVERLRASAAPLRVAQTRSPGPPRTGTSPSAWRRLALTPSPSGSFVPLRKPPTACSAMSITSSSRRRPFGQPCVSPPSTPSRLGLAVTGIVRLSGARPPASARCS